MQREIAARGGTTEPIVSGKESSYSRGSFFAGGSYPYVGRSGGARGGSGFYEPGSTLPGEAPPMSIAPGTAAEPEMIYGVEGIGKGGTSEPISRYVSRSEAQQLQRTYVNRDAVYEATRSRIGLGQRLSIAEVQSPIPASGRQVVIEGKTYNKPIARDSYEGRLVYNLANSPTTLWGTQKISTVQRYVEPYARPYVIKAESALYRGGEVLRGFGIPASPGEAVFGRTVGKERFGTPVTSRKERIGEFSIGFARGAYAPIRENPVTTIGTEILTGAAVGSIFRGVKAAGWGVRYSAAASGFVQAPLRGSAAAAARSTYKGLIIGGTALTAVGVGATVATAPLRGETVASSLGDTARSFALMGVGAGIAGKYYDAQLQKSLLPRSISARYELFENAPSRKLIAKTPAAKKNLPYLSLTNQPQRVDTSITGPMESTTYLKGGSRYIYTYRNTVTVSRVQPNALRLLSPTELVDLNIASPPKTSYSLSKSLYSSGRVVGSARVTTVGGQRFNYPFDLKLNAKQFSAVKGTKFFTGRSGTIGESVFKSYAKALGKTSSITNIKITSKRETRTEAITLRRGRFSGVSLSTYQGGQRSIGVITGTQRPTTRGLSAQYVETLYSRGKQPLTLRLPDQKGGLSYRGSLNRRGQISIPSPSDPFGTGGTGGTGFTERAPAKDTVIETFVGTPATKAPSRGITGPRTVRVRVPEAIGGIRGFYLSKIPGASLGFPGVVYSPRSLFGPRTIVSFGGASPNVQPKIFSGPKVQQGAIYDAFGGAKPISGNQYTAIGLTGAGSAVRLGTIPFSPSPSIPRVISPSIPPPDFTPRFDIGFPGFFLPPKGAIGAGRGKASRPGAGRRYSYTPSLVALSLGIKGKVKTPKGGFTGFEIRPIPL